MSVRRIVLVLSALAAVLLSLEKVGVFRVLPAGDVGFQTNVERAPDGRDNLVLRSDVGDLSCWIGLTVRVDVILGAWDATMPGGDRLVVTVEDVNRTEQRLSISKAPDAQKRESFIWRAGSPIVLSGNGSATRSVQLVDWTVYATAQPSDSAAKASLRSRWTRISWVLLALSLAGAALTAWPQKEEPRIATSLALVRTIVSTIDGHNTEETRLLRAFLTKVLLEGVPVRESLDALKIPSTPYRIRPQFVARARRIFVDRISTVKQDLDALGDRLNVHL